MAKIKVLYVDDEENNLIAFRANFRKAYEVFTAISATTALEILEQNKIQIVISDQRMPEITGVEFLEKVVELYPDTIRLLITGQADIEVVIEAINRGQVSKYIQKPWDWDKLSVAIDNCVTVYTSRVELKEKNEQLQKINEELNKFVYSVSHDLRSPLTSILGIINLSKLLPELEPAHPYFQMIEGRVLKLDGLIRKIIDYYKNARAEEEIVPIDFEPLLQSVWNNLKPHDNSIEFKLHVNQGTTFAGDLYRIEVLLENLISNAIKYQVSENLNRTIEVSADVDEKRVKLMIADNGIGIREEYFDSIFKLFFRTEDAVHTEGTGIGLYIVKEAVDKMKGEIVLKSNLKQGTTFQIILPNRNTL